MPLGQLIASLGADLSQLDRDLAAGYAKFEAYTKRVEALQTRLSAPGVSGGRGTGASGSIDAEHRRVETARQAAEAQQRRMVADQNAAEREQRQRLVTQAQAERENARIGADAMRAKMADLKQQILLKRELDRTEAEERRAVATQSQAERDNARLSAETMRAKQADLKQQILLKRELERQDKDEQKAVDRNLKEVERRRVQMLREDTQSKQNDVKQQMVFRRELDRQDEASAKAARQAAKEEMAAKNADVKQQMVLRRELDRQDKESEKAKQQAAKEELAAKNANVKQQILLQRELDRQDKEEARAQAQQQRDEIRIAKVARVREEFEKSNSVVARMDKAILALDGGSLQNMLGTVKQIGRAFGVVGAFGIAGAVAAITKGGIELNREYQRQLTTMASILAMTTRVVDSQGHQVGRQQALNVQLAEAGKLYTLIRKEAASTILTGRELFGAVSANLGLGSAAGLKPEQTVQLSKQITQLAKASGLQGERQFAQETRALLTGQGLQSGTVARILGIFSKKQVEEHIQKGDLFTYIMDRINKAKPFLDRFRTSMDGVLTTLTTKAQDLNRMAFEKFFEKLTKRIGDLNNVLTQERLEQWAEKISDGLIKVFDAIDKFVSGDGFQKLVSFFNILVTNGTSIIAVLAALRGALALGGASATLRGFQRSEASRAARAAELAGQVGNLSSVANGARAATIEGEAASASGAIGGLGRAAGIAAAGLSVLGAGLAGYAIGTAVNQFLFNLTGAAGAERQENASREALEKMRTGRGAQGLRVGEANARIHETRLALANARLNGDPDADLRGTRGSAKKERDAAVYMERLAQKDIAAERKKTVDNQFRLESLQAEENARKRREAANEERVKAGLELGKLRDDKVREINAQAQLDAIQAKKRIADQSLLRKVLVEIEKKRIDDVRDYRAQRLIDFQQELAKETGMVRQAAAADYAATVKAIEDKKYSEDQEASLKLAAQQSYRHKLRDLDVEEFLRKKQLEADSTGNVVLQLNLEYAQKEEAIRKEVRAHYQGQAAIREFRKETAQNEIGHQRALRDVITQNEDKARDLARRGIQTERERAETIKRFTREVADAQKQAAREIRDLIREQTDARRDLVRAQRAGQFSEQRIGRRQQTLRGGGFLPATEGVEGTNFALQDEAGSLLRQFGIDTQVQRALVARNGKTLGEAMTGRQLRQLRDTFSGGDVEGGLGQLKELGISAQPRFAQSLRELGAKALGNQEAGAQLGDLEGREQLKQQREDAGRQIEDAQRRIEELDQRHAEVLDSYKETISRLHVDFNQAVLKNADDLKSLSEEARRLAETLKASGISIRQDFANALRKTAGGPTTQVGAEAAAQAQGAPVYNLIFNAESIKLDATGQEALRALADTLTQQKLRTAPARR
jgi:hypothetical protein